ncbi:MAG TPA: hypothetical protein VIP80_12965 [Gemmatimonadales bacterium]|jgi:hypothetical protein
MKRMVWFAAVLGACAKEVPIVEVAGECAAVFDAQVCTWSRMQGQKVIDVGALVPLASIENAPKEAAMTWPPVAAATLPLPTAVQQETGLTHLTVFWEPMGHPPGPYLTPHFDFHFYMVPPGEVAAIDCSDLTKPAALPAGYSLPDQELPPELAKMTGVNSLIGMCVPQMGMHSLLTTELESKDTFRGSLVVGYIRGKPIFVEPMLTRAMLMEQRSFELPVPSIPGASGRYPRTFHAEYDAQQRAYRFVWSGFAAAD